MRAPSATVPISGAVNTARAAKQQLRIPLIGTIHRAFQTITVDRQSEESRGAVKQVIGPPTGPTRRHLRACARKPVLPIWIGYAVNRTHIERHVFGPSVISARWCAACAQQYAWAECSGGLSGAALRLCRGWAQVIAQRAAENIERTRGRWPERGSALARSAPIVRMCRIASHGMVRSILAIRQCSREASVLTLRISAAVDWVSDEQRSC